MVDQFIFIGSNISSTERSVNIHKAKTWTAMDRVMIILKSDLSDKLKLKILQVLAM